ncbi:MULTISPECIES: hypothetical protein [unclassified Sphingomonas]|nr:MULTISPECIES: hypothetical protein [unclassified Sphingomonas]
MDREVIAYGLIILVVVIGLPLGAWSWEKRRRQKLRRQGIKRYGH